MPRATIRAMDTELVKWVLFAVVSPLLVWIGGVLRGRNAERRDRDRRMRFLRGLPSQNKAVLVEFCVQGTHTLRLDPTADGCKLLVAQQILIAGPGGGSYDAVDRYLTIAPEYWELMDEWARRDKFARQLSRQRARELLRT